MLDSIGADSGSAVMCDKTKQRADAKAGFGQETAMILSLIRSRCRGGMLHPRISLKGLYRKSSVNVLLFLESIFCRATRVLDGIWASEF